MDGLHSEWQLRAKLLKEKKIDSIYFGGGTPALMGAQNIEAILSWIHYSDDCEITLEANPEEITLKQLQEYQAAGINRISLGVQSFNDKLLTFLGRHHNSKQALEAIYNTKEAGIDNITIDLMYEVPEQTVAMWKESLNQVSSLPITHLSLYNLTIEPNTPFYKKKEKLQSLVATEEETLAMYHAAQEHFEKIGLEQYEISAFARPGFRSRHNVGYWTARPFLGFGPSAFSYWNKQRFRNIANLNRYCNKVAEGKLAVDYEESLDHDARARELLAVELRLFDGVDLKKIEPLSKETQSSIAKLIQLKLLERTSKKLRLTEKGVPLYDSVAAEII